eukprot:47965-Eustigmatos_ZCMA.PRE.1
MADPLEQSADRDGFVVDTGCHTHVVCSARADRWRGVSRADRDWRRSLLSVLGCGVLKAQGRSLT